MDQNQGHGGPNNQDIGQTQNVVALKAQAADVSDPYDGVSLEEVCEEVCQRESNVKDENSEEGEPMPSLVQFLTAPATQAPQAAHPPLHLPEHTGLIQSFHLAAAVRSHQFEMEART